jgi:hypothetical protein
MYYHSMYIVYTGIYIYTMYLKKIKWNFNSILKKIPHCNLCQILDPKGFDTKGRWIMVLNATFNNISTI